MSLLEDDDVPGGSAYRDVASVLFEAASGIEPEAMLAMKHFSLHEAMMAIEVMDPRMDSGVARPEYHKGSFDPHALLLPEEVCWIIDQTFAAEILWHTGHSLSQSVFTCLYTHEISPGRMWYNNQRPPGITTFETDPQRPTQLVSIVLKAAVVGLLKSCDLAWRELTKGHVIEMEDFNGEKSERFMCETISEAEVLGMLGAAKLWLMSEPASFISMRAELIARIDLRRSILVILSSCLAAEVKHLQPNVSAALSHLRDLQASSTPPPPNEDSPAYRAFDPAIARRLLSVMPLKIIPLPAQAVVWDDYFLFLQSIEELCLMANYSSILAVKELLELHACQPPLANRTGLIRSFSYTALLKSKGDVWADELLHSMANVSSGAILPAVPLTLTQQPPISVKPFVDKMTQEYFASFFCNRPRQRRRLCNWMTKWAALPLRLQDYMTSASSKDSPNLRKLHRLFLYVSILRFMSAGHVILAGLELDIHDSNERPFIFWYGAVVHNTLHDALEVLRKESEGVDSSTYYLFYEMMWSSLMGQFLMASCQTSLLLACTPDCASPREEANFQRRFKWAFGSGDEESPPGSSYQYRSDPCTPRFEDWKPFRELQRQEPPRRRAQICGATFQKLEDSVRAYESVVQAEYGIGSLAKARSDVSAAQEPSARLRLEILREMREVASTNSKRLLSIREPGPILKADGNTTGSTSADLEARFQLPMFEKAAGGSRWFPTVL